MKIDINKKQFNKWLHALYSNKYPQGYGRLQYEDGYCCLGVGIKCLVPKNKITFKDRENTIIYGSFPENQDNSPEWLKEINQDFEDKAGASLSQLNDEGYDQYPPSTNSIKGPSEIPFTHPEIAMVLDLVYNYKILDNE